MRDEGLSSDVSIRFMTAADIPAGLELCRAAHWNQTARDWEFLLSYGPEAALAAEEEGRVVGTVATVPYGPFTWISMVLVDPLSRGKGIGRLLLERGLALLAPGVVARLDATAAGEPLYRSLGFEAEYGLTRWFVDAMPTPERPADVSEAAPSARPLAPRDWPMILKMDRHVFGASRAALLERMAAEAPEYAWVLEVNERLRGYMFGRHGHVREHLGPLIADTLESAHVILEACLSSHASQSFFIDVPDRDDRWADLLAARGFAIERPFLRMYRRRLAAPGVSSVVYAVTGPEFG